jgi:hypothetical protein
LDAVLWKTDVAAEINMRFAFCSGVLLVAAGASVSNHAMRVQVGPGPSVRIVEPHAGQSPSEAVPSSNGSAFEDVILRVSSRVHAPTGIERVVEDPSIRAPLVRNPRAVTVDGHSLAELLDVFVREPRVGAGTPQDAPLFSWSDNGRVIHVTQFGSRPTALDTVVPSFTLTKASLRDALTAVHRIFDPDRPASRGEAGSIAFRPPVDSVLPSRLGEPASVARPPMEDASELSVDWDAMFNDGNISLALTNVSARTVLDEVVLHSGKGSWVVRYRDETGTYPACRLAFTLFDSRVTTQLEARLR